MSRTVPANAGSAVALAFDATPPARLPTKWGEFRVVAYRFATPEGIREHLAILKGDVSGEDVLARVHSSCLTGDVLASHRCDCGAQLALALGRLEEDGRGVVIYLSQEGRGIGLYNKIRAYTLQDKGANTVEANERLGFDADGRDYGEAVAMLRSLGVSNVRLMTNNPRKVEALEAAGIRVSARVAHMAGETDHNQTYLSHKRDLLGHLL